MILVAAALGYLIGSLPTAGWLGGRSGVDLRTQGSRNPGANNALRLGGRRLAAMVLLTEIGKGATAILAGTSLVGTAGAVAAGLGALAGNIFNVWYSFDGGQGLGISAGIMLAAWPLWFPAVIAVIAGVARVTRSSARAALAAMAALAAGAALELAMDLPDLWGVESPSVALLAAGMLVLIVPKQVGRLRSHHPPA